MQLPSCPSAQQNCFRSILFCLSPLTLKKRSTKRLSGQLAYVDAHYSDELKGVLTYLLTKGATIEGLASALAFRSMDAFEQSVTREGTPMPPTNLCLPKC